MKAYKDPCVSRCGSWVIKGRPACNVLNLEKADWSGHNRISWFVQICQNALYWMNIHKVCS